MKNPNKSKSNLIPHKVNINLYVLGALVMNRVGGQVDSRDLVKIYQGGTSRREAEVTKKMPKPGSLGHCIGDDTVFSLGTGSRDGKLALGGPRNK